MILPTKYLPINRSLLHMGGELLILLDEQKTVSRLWEEWKEKKYQGKTTSYDWFVLSLDLLFMLKAIDISEGLVRRNN